MPPATWLRSAPPAGIVALLGGVLLLMAWLLPAALVAVPADVAGAGGSPETGDLATYKAIVAAVNGGASYYEAAHAELIKHYGTRSAP